MANYLCILAILRPPSPASSSQVSSPSRHSSYTSSSRPKTQLTEHSTTIPSALTIGTNSTTSSCSQSPVHHRANSGPTIVTSLFAESDQMTQSAIVQPASPHLGMSGNNGAGGATTGSQLWKTRLTNIKNSFLGSPRFHRRKMQSN